MRPLAIDLYCGLGGWTDGLLAEGYDVIGFDIERHDYGTGGYPAQLVLQDVLTLHGRQFKDAAIIVASPPCQGYSYRAMPWSRAKALPPPDNSLFEACFRIQREACEAAGRFIPLIVENVRGAQKWVGRSRWNYGSFHLWGDVPALMPMVKKAAKAPGQDWNRFKETGEVSPDWKMQGTKNNGGSWFNIGSPGQKEVNRNPVHEFVGQKTKGHINKRNGHGHTRHLTNQRESDGVKHGGDCFNDPSWPGKQGGTKQPGISGVRANGKGDRWFQDGAAAHGSKSSSRKAASAAIAKIPFPLSQYIARCFKPGQYA